MKRRGEVFGSGGWRVGSIGQVRYCTSVAGQVAVDANFHASGIQMPLRLQFSFI
jgi:hypothetical protein